MECYRCGFWDSDYEGCTCPSVDRWYACPIESEKPENKKELEEYGKWCDEQAALKQHEEQETARKYEELARKELQQ